MKRITFLLIAIIACFVTAAAQVDTTEVQSKTTENGIEYTDTPDTPGGNKAEKSSRSAAYSYGFDLGSNDILSIVAVVSVFGLPVLIVFIAFFFKYKNRKAKYRLAEQALAAGQPIPEDFFKGKVENNILQKGITNIFTGIGLFIFLWAVTTEFSIGTIGLLVMFTGFGQVIIHYTQNNKKNKAKDKFFKNNNNSIEE